MDPFVNLKSEWIKDIVFFVKPISRYYVFVYTTGRKAGNSLGGIPLPEFLFGLQDAGLSFTVMDHFSLSGSYGRWMIFPYKTSYKRDKSSPYSAYYQRHYYLFSFMGSVTIKKRWKASLSYSLLDRLDRQGRIETVLFDDCLSTWAFSVSYSFSFDSLKRASL